MKNAIPSKNNVIKKMSELPSLSFGSRSWVKDGGRLGSFFLDLYGWETAEVAPGSRYGVMDASSQAIGGGNGPSQKGARNFLRRGR